MIRSKAEYEGAQRELRYLNRIPSRAAHRPVP